MTTSTRRSFVVSEAVAARVVAEHPHPNADRLRIAVVEAGERRWRVVYGGTRRLTVGDVVPVATPGTRLTAVSGLRLPPLRARNFRGVRSEAMLCSSDELGWTRNGPDEVLVLDSGHEVGALVRRLSGRCHGPGCTQTADDEFCSTACQDAWHAQFRWLHGDGPARRPENKRLCPRCGMDCVTDWVDVTEVGQPPGSEFVAGNLRCPQGHWDLQSETLQQDVPVVDETHVWDATDLEPYQRAMDAAVRGLAAAADMSPTVLNPDPDGPTSADWLRAHAAAMRPTFAAAATSFANVSAAADEARRQDDRLRAAFWPPERADEAITRARELARTSTLTYQQAVDKVIDDDARARADRFASANAEFPQVASRSDPTRGWLPRLLDRWTRRTT